MSTTQSTPAHLDEMTGLEFPLYVVYDHPLDYPALFIARRWVGLIPQEIVARSESLAEVRAKLPDGLTNIGRHASDDPAIYEVWI